MSFKVDAGGIRELGASTELRQFMDQVGQDCVDAAKDLAPVDTGKLRDSIAHKVDREDGAWMVTVYFDKFYGMFKEFGTAKLPAVPFLRPGVVKAISGRGGRLGDSGPS